MIRRAWRIYDEQREQDTLDDWTIWRNGKVFARCERLGSARGLVSRTMSTDGEGDTWEIIDSEGGNPGLTYDDGYDALVSKALAEDARVGRRLDADGFYDFFPDHDHEAICLAWSIYDQMRKGSSLVRSSQPTEVLTCAGTTFAGRVAASLLSAAGLEELITRSLEDYESLALKFAQDQSLLDTIRERIKSSHHRPLFDTAQFTRRIEAAYTEMWNRLQKGGRPMGFAVET